MIIADESSKMNSVVEPFINIEQGSSFKMAAAELGIKVSCGCLINPLKTKRSCFR
jgi:hypothetical protein